jgi:prophage regulatory protein
MLIMKFMKLPDVIEKTGLSRSTIYLLMKKGDFPAQIKLGCKSVVWLEDDISQWQTQIVSHARGHKDVSQ